MRFNIKENFLFNLFTVAVIIIFAANAGIVVSDKNMIGQKVKAAEELKRPADISLTTIKDSSCADCADISPIVNMVKKTNVKIVKEETLEANSAEGKKIIQELGLKKLPTFIARGEIGKNEDVKAFLGRIGEISGDTFKFSYPVAPYTDVASNTVKGRVSLILVSDKTCKECYDVNIHKTVLARFGVSRFLSEKTLDASDKEIAKYKIQAAPTFILTGEVGEYGDLIKIWPRIGTIEKDGAYVFREINQLGAVIYKDLKTGKIVKPEAPKQ